MAGDSVGLADRTADSTPTGATGAGGRLGVGAAIALVVGNVVGTGVFLLPAQLATYGTISILALVGVTIGAVALATVFGKLGARTPAAGGPYAYARTAFGEFPGFLNAWSYWITAWAGSAGIAVAWVGYVNYFLHWDSTMGRTVIALVGLWIPALINLTGIKNMGAVQVLTTVLKFAPLLFIAVVGVFYIRTANFGPFNATTDSWIGALSLAGAVALFVYSGMESVAIAAERIKDPERNIGRATVFGTLACAAVYLLSTVAIFGTVPHNQLVTSQAPFADAINNMFGGGFWGGVIAAAAVVSGLGALNGWTLLVAEMPLAAARDGLFPAAFARLSGRGAAYVGILVGTVLTSLTVVLNYAWSANAFETILLLATFTTVIPYFFSACAQLYWLVVAGRGRVRTAHLARDVTLAVVAMLFAFWMMYGSGEEAVFQGVLLLLAGVPVYAWLKARKEVPWVTTSTPKSAG